MIGTYSEEGLGCLAKMSCRQESELANWSCYRGTFQGIAHKELDRSCYKLRSTEQE